MESSQGRTLIPKDHRWRWQRGWLEGQSHERAVWAPTDGKWSPWKRSQLWAVLLRTLASNPEAALPSREHQTEEGTHITCSCEKKWGAFFQGVAAESLGTLLTDQPTKIPCGATHLMLWQREGVVDCSCESRTQEWGVRGESSDGRHPKFPGLSHSLTQLRTSFPHRYLPCLGGRYLTHPIGKHIGLRPLERFK